VAKRLVTQAYSLTEEQIEALRTLGEQDGRRGASEALREILDRDPEVSKIIHAQTEAA
jgi:Fe2+ or Zn2+ uptake regulation protein